MHNYIMEKQMPEKKVEVEVPNGTLVRESPGVWKAKNYGMELRELVISKERGVRVKLDLPQDFWLSWKNSTAAVRFSLEIAYDPKTLKVTGLDTKTHPSPAPPKVIGEVDGVDCIRVKIGAKVDEFDKSIREILGCKPIEKDFEEMMGFKPNLHV
jgi:hypothetical protein